MASTWALRPPAKPWSMLRLRSSTSTISAPRPTRSTGYSGRYGPARPSISAASASTAAPRSAHCSRSDAASCGTSVTQALGKATPRRAHSGSSASGNSHSQPGASRLMSCTPPLGVAAAAAEVQQPAAVDLRRVAREEHGPRALEELRQLVAQQLETGVGGKEALQPGLEQRLDCRLVQRAMHPRPGL